MCKSKALLLVFLNCVIAVSLAVAGNRNDFDGTLEKISGKNYRLSIFYRDGTKAVADAKLETEDKTKIPFRLPTSGVVYVFSIENCGKLRFFQSSDKKSAVLDYFDENFANLDANCPINFGAAGSNWKIE